MGHKEKWLEKNKKVNADAVKADKPTNKIEKKAKK